MDAPTRTLITAAAALTFTCFAHAAGERLTQNCRIAFDTGEIVVEGLPAKVRMDWLAVVANPALDPDLYHRLWRPRSGAAIFSDGVILDYGTILDTGQITGEILADPVLTAAGIRRAWSNSFICIGNPPPARIVVTEYYNNVVGHYFLSSSTLENEVIDSGGAGPGWSRTGETFETVEATVCDQSRPIFRFYNPGANTHFFTVDPLECGGLRRSDPGWVFEAEAFGAHPPSAGACPGRTTPIYRLYNNRWMFNDSNHRFVKRLALYEQMRAAGWAGEGVAMCLDRTGSDYRQTP